MTPDPAERARARTLLRDGRIDAAVTALESMLREVPADPDLNTLLGQAYLARGDTESALDHFNLGLHYDPESEAALRGRVEALDRRGEEARATGAYEDFLAANPGHRGATVALAWRQYRRGRRDSAAELLEALIVRDASAKEGLSLLGLVLAREFGDFARGETLLRRALEVDPGFDAARSNLGWVLGEGRRFGEALACFDEVLARRPDDHETRLMRAHLNLKRGEFAAAWDDFEARHESMDALERPFAFRRWRGELLDRRALLVTAEQGIGDQIMFASCLPDVLACAQGGRCWVEAEPRLVTLFARSFLSASVRASVLNEPSVPWLAQTGEIDFQIPIGSLPAMFRRSRAAFPDHRGYLRADPQRVAYWRRRLSECGPPPWIGISWRGGAPTNRRYLRSIDFHLLLASLRGCGTAISLQYGDCAEEVARSSAPGNTRVPHWPEALADYDETAALVCALDRVVSVCTAIVHLAGALGQPVWVLVPWAPEWRYLAEGQTMPWYPSARLFRQDTPGDWEGVLHRVHEEFMA